MQERESRPGGGGNPRNCQSGGNDGTVFTRGRRSLQEGRAPSALGLQSPIGARRYRLISRIQGTPDSAERWALFVTRIARLIDDDEQIDQLLGALVEVPPATIAVFKRAAVRWPREPQ